MSISNSYPKDFKWKFLCQKLVLENCLVFGQHSQFTSKNITKYLLGTRGTIEVFKLYELRYLLLRIYPLIHTLFYNPRVKLKLSVKKWKPPVNVRNQSLSPANKRNTKIKYLKKKTSFIVKHRSLPPQILFATITPAFAGIISQAAKICNMPYHQKRWLNGSITAALSHTFDTKLWSNIEDYTQQENIYFFRKQWGKNKENWTKSKEKARYFNHSRWPSLIIIPDIANNTMILSEIKKIGLPVIGLVNSHCRFEIEYPIFAQDQNFSSVHFFCYFLATLIAKETVYTQHKRHTKNRPLRTKQNHLPKVKRSKRQLQKVSKISFRNLVTQQTIKEYWKKPFFFSCLKFAKKKISNRYPLIYSYPWKAHFILQETRNAFKQLKKKTKHQYYKMQELETFFRQINWQNSFKKLRRHLEYVPLDFKTATLLKNIWHLKKQILEKHSRPTPKFFQKEKKKKNWSRQAHNFLLSFEKKYLIQSLFRNFLWIHKKLYMFWKYKPSVSNKRILQSLGYYWRSLQHFCNELKWKSHKHILPKILYKHKKRKLFDKKHWGQKQKPKLLNRSWKTWVKKTKKYSKKKSHKN